MHRPFEAAANIDRAERVEKTRKRRSLRASDARLDAASSDVSVYTRNACGPRKLDCARTQRVKR
jgi:hypothetical protein